MEAFNIQWNQICIESNKFNNNQNFEIMSSPKNSVTLIGHLGNDPEVKNFDSGKVKATISLAVNRTYKNASGEKVENTDWPRLVLWGKVAENAGKYLTKGDKIAIQGELRTEKYEKEDGTMVYQTVIAVDECEYLNVKHFAKA